MRLLPFAIVALCAALSLPAAAQDSTLRALSTADAGRGWQAVGRLNLGDRSFCTATLIAPDRVLTAAHCLFDRTTGARIPDAEITFLAGWRTGRAEAIRGVRRAAIEPGFRMTTGETLDRVASDLALLELDRPIRTTAIRPFAVAAGQPRSGAQVALVSYARERSEQPSLQESCQVLEQRRDGVTVLSCEIDFGASGSPVFTVEQGEPRILSVISAKAEGGGRQLALGMRLSGRIEGLEAMLSAPGLAAQGLAAAPSGGARDAARFVRAPAP